MSGRNSSAMVFTYVRRAISWDVCGKMCTFSWWTSVETVAVGFCAGERYSGPMHWDGPCAGGIGSEGENDYV